MTKSTLAGIVVAGTLALATSKANAGPIMEFSATGIDGNGTLSGQMYSDFIDINVNGIVDINNILTPAANIEDLNKLYFQKEGYACDTSGNYFLCQSIDGSSSKNIDWRVSIKPEFKSIYHFTGVEESDRNNIFVFGDNDHILFEPGFNFILEEKTEDNIDVNAPVTGLLGALGLGVLAYRRTKQLPRTTQ